MLVPYTPFSEITPKVSETEDTRGDRVGVFT